jgi:hypothetical protein
MSFQQTVKLITPGLAGFESARYHQSGELHKEHSLNLPQIYQLEIVKNDILTSGFSMIYDRVKLCKGKNFPLVVIENDR